MNIEKEHVEELIDNFTDIQNGLYKKFLEEFGTTITIQVLSTISETIDKVKDALIDYKRAGSKEIIIVNDMDTNIN